MLTGSVLVTGGTGFVGSHLVRRLVRDGLDVNVIARAESSTSRIEDISQQVRIWRGDLSDMASLRHCVEECRPKAVFHLAGLTGIRTLGSNLTEISRGIDTNLKGTLAILSAIEESSAPVRIMIRAGGLEEYGNGPFPYREEQRESPVSAYSASQVATTHYCQMLQPYLRFAAVTLRPALIYGPGQSSQFFIPSLIDHCLRNEPFDMSSGEQTRDLIYVADVVDAFVRAAQTERIGGEVMNIGSGCDYAMRDVAATIVQLTGASSRINLNARPQRPTEIKRLICSTEKARRLLGWAPQTGLEDGLTQTIEWFRNRSAES